MKNPLYLGLILFGTILSSCSGGSDSEGDTSESAPSEFLENLEVRNHSYAQVQDAYTKHLHLDLNVDFDRSVISGSVRHDIENPSGGSKIVFDVHNLAISKVLADGNETTFEIGETDDLLGAPLAVDIEKGTKTVEIFYETSPTSKAVQWLNPQQTAGKQQPYLFTQGQAILTRSWIPCQDTPEIRITYSADVKVPSDLMAVMSANNPTEKNDKGEYSYKMEYPIPSYLIALAVGDLAFAELGPRSGVYTEPSIIDQCVYEFADVEQMISVTEGLYGEYKWGRYDIIVLPPSFPFGGMENPMLTFATPTILSGDRSLVSLIAHELAHSWSGNLVTNATWDDFWLNEGFTVYIENRIMEAIYGRERSDMLLSIEHHDLLNETNDILSGDHPEDTHLKLNLTDRDPDEGMTSIAYVKGALFLKTLEEAVGREAFDVFLKQYFSDNEFKVMTTEKFTEYLQTNLLTPSGVDFNTDEWINGKGIPDNCVAVESDKFDIAAEKASKVTQIMSADELGVKREDWSTQEWMHFIRNLPADLEAQHMVMLDMEFGFSTSGNSEIMCEWFVLAVEKDYEGAYDEMEEFLINVGRRKFLQPIYEALAATEDGKKRAEGIYGKARENYHSVSYLTIDEILDWKES